MNKPRRDQRRGGVRNEPHLNCNGQGKERTAMQDILPGRTARETRLSADQGRTAAIAVGWQLYARYLYVHAAEDMAILGIRDIPGPRAQSWPVTGGTDEERMARVDKWAERHGVKAGPDETSGQYKAVLAFGVIRQEVYMIPDRTMDERLAAIRKAVAEREVAA